MKTLKSLKSGVLSIDASTVDRTIHSASKKAALFLSAMAAVSMAQGADISWSGGTADYTNAPSWVGGVVPGPGDNAINDSGSNNVVRIQVGNPDWTVNQIRAGNGAGDGAFVQDGQTVTLNGVNSGTGFVTPFRLGFGATNTGIYTLNGGSLTYSNGSFNVGEVGTGILNINGGTISGRGNFAVNLGTVATPTAVNATVGNGLTEGDFTWYEQGFNTVNPSAGLAAPGTTIVSLSQPDHSYNLPPTYTGSDAVLLATNLTSATITLTTPVAGSGLSFLLTSGNGASTVNYTVHHANASTDTGSLTVPDWFGPGSAQEVLAVATRVDALGSNFQFPTPANGFTGSAPYLWSLDIAINDTVSPVTSIDLTFGSAGNSVVTILSVSSQATIGGAFTPVAITGFNKDVILESGAAVKVASTITDIVNQVNGTVTLNGELWTGNGGAGVYNLSGGTINASNWLVTGRAGGNGTFNMTGGTINKAGNGQFVISTRTGSKSVGTFNQSAGAINSSSEYWIGQGDNNAGGSIGTNNISGTATLVLSNWLAVGREGGVGVLNISGGSITKGGNGNLTITHGSGASGTINQSGGSITIASGEVWIGEDSAAGTWNMSGGTATVGLVHIAQNASASGTLNLSGGVMTLQELAAGSLAAVSQLTLNGGTIRAAGNNANFLHDITVVNVSSGGAIFDSAGFDITASQAMPNSGGDGSGGLTKNGLGTLTLSGINSYTGPTVVNAGTLVVGTATTANGDYTVASGAGLSTVVQSANGQLNMSSLTVSGPAVLNFDLGGFGNPVSAPLNVFGTYTASGTITINIADQVPLVGQFPLIKYGALSGSPTFVIGTLPTGVGAIIVNNTANNSIDLNITGVNLPRWDGQAGGNWDIGVTTNWVNIGTGLPTFYGDGNAVLFDDSALGTTTVNLTTTVKPLSITANNTNLAYSFTGSGKISGATGINKQGPNVLSILNTGGNDYTGATVISNGVLAVTSLANGGSPSAIGASSANPTNLVLVNAGTLSYSGPATTINRGYSAPVGGGIDTESDLTLTGLAIGGTGTFTKAGPALLAYTGVNASNVLAAPAVAGSTYLIRAGTVLLDGSAGPQTNYARNLNVGADAGTNATIILTNTTLQTRLTLGNNANCVGTMILNSNSFLKVLGGGGNFVVGGQSANAGSPTTGVLIQNPGSTVDSDAELWVAQGPAATGVYNMNGGTTIFRNWVAIGRNGGPSATFNMTGGTITKTPNNNFMIGSRDGTTGTVGTLNQSGGTILVGSEYWIGEAQNNAAASIGTNNISGTATLVVSNWIAIGREGAIGVLNLSGGSITKLGTSGNHIEIGNGNGSQGIINQTGGAFNNTISETRLGTGAPGIWNMSGGTANLAALVFCLNSGCTNGTLNLNGGVMTAREIRANQTAAANVSTLNLNGGTIAAGNGANANFLHNLTAANVLAGGVTFDSATNTININQSLLDGTGGGGLTKIGNGTLNLNGTNTYTGSTLVSTGALGGSGTIAGPVNVATGARLAPGAASIGTLTINNSLTFSNASSAFFRISNAGSVTNNDKVTGLTAVTYNGSLVVSNTGGSLIAGSVFKLFNAAGAGAGNFSSVTILPAGSGTFNPATGELTITSTGNLVLNKPFVSSGNLVVTGVGTPGAGYTLLSSTNLTLPLAQWETNSTGVFDGTGASSNAIPLSATNRFFLLRQP